MFCNRRFPHHRAPVLFSQVPKAWFRTVAPSEDAADIIDLDVVKQHCRVPLDLTEDDGIFATYILECEKYIEDRCDAAFREQTWELALEHLPDVNERTGLYELRLERPPVTAVNSVKYYDQDNTLQTLDPSFYTLEAKWLPPLLNLNLWNANITFPSEPTHKSLFTVNFTCGSEGLSAQAKAALLSLVAHRYRNREAVGSLNTSTVLPLALTDQIESLKWRP